MAAGFFWTDAVVKILLWEKVTLRYEKNTNLGELLLAFKAQRAYMRLDRESGGLGTLRIILCWF